MNIHADPLFVRAEVDRRLELAGVHPHARQEHELHRHEVLAHPVAADPLAAFVARLVAWRPGVRPSGTSPSVAPRRPRHP